jgi:hypothetical protein
MQSYIPEQLKLVPKPYTPLMDFAREFKADYTAAVIDLSEWASARKEKEKSLDMSLDDAHQNVSSLMRALDLRDRKSTYELLKAEDLLPKIQNNRDTYTIHPTDISDILSSFATEEGKRVFHRAKSSNYFGMHEAVETAKNLYVRRVVGELGGNDPIGLPNAIKLAAYALDVDVKTIRRHLDNYEEKVVSGAVISFKEWEQNIKKNPELILFYESKMNPGTVPLMQDIPKPEKGKKRFKEQSKIRVIDMNNLRQANHDENDDTLEMIAEVESAIANVRKAA